MAELRAGDHQALREVCLVSTDTVASSHGYEFAAPVRQRPVACLVIVLALLAYMYLMVFQTVMTRVALFWLPIPLALLLLVRGPFTLVPLLPLLFALGIKPYHIGQFFPTGATLAGFFFFAYYAWHKMVHDEPIPSPNATQRLLIAALLLQIVSIVISIHHHGQHFFNAIRDGSSIMLFLPLAFILPDLLDNRSKVLILLRGMLLALLLSSLVAVLTYAGTAGFSRTDISIGYVYRLRVGSLFGAPNVFGGYLELALPLALALVFFERRWIWRSIALLAAVLGFLSTLYTFSRAAFILTVFGSALVLVYRFRRRLWVPLAALVALFLFMSQNADTFARQLSLVTEPQDLYTQPTLLHRYVTYRSYIEDFGNHVWTGRGWGALEYFWGRTGLYSFWDVRHTRSTRMTMSFGGLNNLVLNHAVKGGLLSLAVLGLLACAAVTASLRAARAGSGIIAVALTASLLSFAGHQLVDNLLRWSQVNGFFWLSLGLLIALSRSRELAE